VLLIAALAGSLAVLRPLRNVQVGRGLAERFDQVCDIADEEPSAVLVSPEGLLGFTLPQSIGAWCDVPTAGATDATTAADVRALAEAWEREGRRLVVLSGSPTPFAGAFGEPLAEIDPLVTAAPSVTYDGAPPRMTNDGRVGRASRLYVFGL
jgi:hypothetical protein